MLHIIIIYCEEVHWNPLISTFQSSIRWNIIASIIWYMNQSMTLNSHNLLQKQVKNYFYLFHQFGCCLSKVQEELLSKWQICFLNFRRMTNCTAMPYYINLLKDTSKNDTLSSSFLIIQDNKLDLQLKTRFFWTTKIPFEKYNTVLFTGLY